MVIELDKALLDQCRVYISQAKHIVITTHMAPDGDAMGSALGIYNWLLMVKGERLKDEGISVIVPNAFPKFLGWMPCAGDIKIYEKESNACNELISKADLFICTDYNDPKRIGALGEKMLANSAPKILIDHHLNPMDFADVVFSYPEATSSCEIVYRFITAISHQPSVISKEIATCIYT